MLEFKTSEKNLENCIISRNNKLESELKDEGTSLFVIEPIKELSNNLGQFKLRRERKFTK
jgi:hypothetical protein